jgi:hypothetical protein
VAVDATGLASGAISTFYVRRTHNRGGEPMLWRRWLKWLVVVDTRRQVLLAQTACSGPYNGSAMLRPLVDAAHEVTPLGVVLADAEFDSEHNHRHVRERLGGGERDSGQARQNDLAGARLPSPDADRFPEAVV